MKTVIIASLLLAVTSATSFAGTPLIDAREHNQQHRIFEGVKQGDLTFRESQQLLKGQAHIRRLENQAKASGGVSFIERARIHAAQNIQSNRIFLKRH